MKLSVIVGGILSSIVIFVMVQSYTSHTASASVSPVDSFEFTTMIPQPRPEVALPTLYDLISTQDFECLVRNVYFEARGESSLAQRAVAWVTMNRVASSSFPDTVCDVVHQAQRDSQGNPIRHQCQFSWYCDGKSDTPTDAQALEHAERMAREVLVNYFDRPDPTEGSLYFHADYVTPSWRRSFNRVVQIDKHIFYNLDQG